jgi:hypothetical protein
MALYNNSGPGAWNDPDMLLGSNPVAAIYLTSNQSRLQFNLWAVTAAPFVIGANMLNMTVWMNAMVPDFCAYLNSLYSFLLDVISM